MNAGSLWLTRRNRREQSSGNTELKESETLWSETSPEEIQVPAHQIGASNIEVDRGDLNTISASIEIVFG